MSRQKSKPATVMPASITEADPADGIQYSLNKTHDTITQSENLPTKLTEIDRTELVEQGYSEKEIEQAEAYYTTKGYEIDRCVVMLHIQHAREEAEERRKAQLRNDAFTETCVDFIHSINESVIVWDLMPELVRYYGNVEPDHSNNILCRWHTERHPSCHIYRNGVHCFGCGHNEDPVGFVASLLAIKQLEAAKIINADFSLGLMPPEKPESTKYKESKTRQLKPQLTIESLQAWLDTNGIQVRRNLITHRIEVTGSLTVEFDRETLDSSLHVIIHDKIKRDYVCSSGLIADQLNVVGGMRRFNPINDYLASVPPWDGTDYISKTYEILNIQEDDELSKILLRKWYRQCIALKDNDENTPFGGDGILTILGPQGVGKTRFIERIAMKPEFVRLGGFLDFRDKDSLIRCTGSWICELGELESSLRSDIERMKAFLTSATDAYRLPYARVDTNLLRRTSFAATANSQRLLVDPSGSRRFWVISVSTIDLDALEKFDAAQLWKQIEHEVELHGKQSFRLTPNEQKMLAERNAEHERPLKSQIEIEDILADAEANPSKYSWQHMTVTAFKDDNPILNRYSAETLGKALDKLGIMQERKPFNGKRNRTRYLPRHHWYGNQEHG